MAQIQMALNTTRARIGHRGHDDVSGPVITYPPAPIGDADAAAAVRARGGVFLPGVGEGGYRVGVLGCGVWVSDCGRGLG